MMELATIRQHNIPVKIIVLKNNYLGMVREYQHYTYKDHYSVVDLSGSPDLEKLSAAYDIPYLRLNNMEHVDEDSGRFSGGRQYHAVRMSDRSDGSGKITEGSCT